MNFFRTAVLLAAMTALFVLVGAALGGPGGMLIALVFAVGANLFTYWNSSQMALAAVDARKVDDRTAPELVGIVRQLAGRAGLPMPRVYLVDSPQPNAFATGRDPANAAVAVNTGLMAALSQEELAGVLSHELGHVRNRDTLTMTMTATLAGAISSIAHWGLFFGGGRRGSLGVFGSVAGATLAPVAAMIVQMAVSRSREYAADRTGAAICGNPLWLASALAKLDAAAKAIPDPVVEARPAMAHLFTVNPLSGMGLDALFSTHPPIGRRIAALQAMAPAMGAAATESAPSPPNPTWRPFRQADPAAAPAGSFLGGTGIASPWRPSAERDTGLSNGRPRGPWG